MADRQEDHLYLSTFLHVALNPKVCQDDNDDNLLLSVIITEFQRDRCDTVDRTLNYRTLVWAPNST